MPQHINPMGYIEEQTQEGRVPLLTTNATDAKADPMGYLYTEREVNGTLGRTPIVRIDGAEEGKTPSLEQVASVGSQTSLPLTAAPAQKDEQLATLGQLRQLLPTSLPANGGNADTVDGKHADDFAKNSLALLYRGGVPDGADVNSYQENGFYWTGGNPTGKPSGMGTIANSFIENGRYGSRMFTSLDDGGKLHFQTTNDHQKDSWHEVYHTGNLNPSNFVPSNLGYGGKTTVATGSLLDYLNKSQLISGIGLTNAPTSSEWFIYNIVVHQPSKHVVVVATAISDTSNHTDTYIGVMDEFEWKGWSKVWTSKNLTPLAMDKASLTSNVNANLIKEPGVYTIAIGNGTGNTNFPMANAYGTFTVVKSGDFYTQVAAHTSPYQYTYTRTGYLPSGNTDNWGEWQLVYTDKSLAAISSDLLDRSYYIHENNTGILIKTKRKDTDEFMGVVRITGNGYGTLKTIDTKLQFYAYPAGAVIINYAAINVGLPIAKINIFFIDRYLHIWLPPFASYNTIKVFISDQASNANLVESITESAMPTAPQRLVTVIPSNVWTDANFNPAKVDLALVRDGTPYIQAEDTGRTMCGFGFEGNGFNTTGSFISFGGFSYDAYQTQLQGEYGAGNNLLFRTKNDDQQPSRWNPWRKLWHNGNFEPASFATAAQGAKADNALSGICTDIRNTAAASLYPSRYVGKTQTLEFTNATTTGLPGGSGDYYNLTTQHFWKDMSGGMVQTAVHTSSGLCYTRTANGLSAWNSWTSPLGQATSWQAVSLAATWTGGIYCKKDSAGNVHIQGYASTSQALTHNTSKTLLTIPYAPSRTLNIPVTSGTYPDGLYAAITGVSGILSITNISSTTKSTIYINIMYAQ